uniref:Uncharacterized protein n=1 Tax=Clandestinovirus TaxID=2831644 RepID=A0A8F8KNW6_9VIRU|nr:hypothetical protein KOM_12_106 [Clandestinovirus]
MNQKAIDYSWIYKEPDYYNKFLIARLPPKPAPPVPVLDVETVQPFGFPIVLCITCALESKRTRMLDFNNVGRPISHFCKSCHTKLADWLDTMCRPKEQKCHVIKYPLSNSISSFNTQGEAVRYARYLYESWIPFTLYDENNSIIAHLSYKDSKMKSVSEDYKKWLTVFDK